MHLEGGVHIIIVVIHSNHVIEIDEPGEILGVDPDFTHGVSSRGCTLAYDLYITPNDFPCNCCLQIHKAYIYAHNSSHHLIVWLVGIIFRLGYCLGITLRYLGIFLDGTFSVSALVYDDTGHVVSCADIFSDKPCNSSANAAIVAHDFIRAVDGGMVLVVRVVQWIIHCSPYPLMIVSSGYTLSDFPWRRKIYIEIHMVYIFSV